MECFYAQSSIISGMKHKILAAFLLLAAALSLTACDAEEMGTLSDLTRPYTGFYECEEIALGGKDMTEEFEKLSLELRHDGSYALSYRTVDGNEGGYTGNYSVDPEKGRITFTGKQGMRTASFSFPYEKGAIRMDYNLFGTMLHANFRMP